MCFNLLDAPWIPVIRTNGKPDKVGIRTALTEAGSIREVCAASPLDTIALYRFLLAVLQWCKPKPSQTELAAIREARAIPATWLTPLDRNPDEFELLGANHGFYQDPTHWDKDKEGNPVAELRDELPSGTNVAHFRHTRDGREGICPACCALGLARLSAFATHCAHPPFPGGRPAGINGGTPTYALLLSDSLLATFLLNWPMLVQKGDRPAWLRRRAPGDANPGCLTGLTWRPRRIWLNWRGAVQLTQGQEKGGPCASCGDARNPLIRRIGFQPGWPRTTRKEGWLGDPHLLRFIEVPKTKTTRGKHKLKGVFVPDPSDPADSHAAFWRRAYEAAMQSMIPRFMPNPPAQHLRMQKALEEPEGRDGITVAFFGAASSQELYKDGRLLTWRLPAGGLGPQAAKASLRELGALRRLRLAPLLRRAAMRPPSKMAGAQGAALAAEALRTEGDLRQRFETFVADIAAAAPEQVGRIRDGWHRDAQALLLSGIFRVHAILCSGSPLRKRLGEETLRAGLREQFEKLTKREDGEVPQPASKAPSPTQKPTEHQTQSRTRKRGQQ
jgi:hypothetical protein